MSTEITPSATLPVPVRDQCTEDAVQIDGFQKFRELAPTLYATNVNCLEYCAVLKDLFLPR